jgi:hypothetical protein
VSDWHIGTSDGKQEGPFTIAELQARVRQGSISAATLVWKKGMSQWAPAAQQAELTSLFTAEDSTLPMRDVAVNQLNNRTPWMTAGRFRVVGRICALLGALGIIASFALAMFGKSFVGGAFQLGLAFLICEGIATVLDKLDAASK